jgi:hypothetical protein
MSAVADKPSAARAALAGLALDAIRGGLEAQKLVASIRTGVAAPDLLLQAVRATFATGNAAICEGFCREIQKRLEV